MQLGGVVFEVEELGLVDLGIDDQLPAVVADSALDVGIGGEDRVPARLPLAGQDWDEALALAFRRGRDARKITQRREDVEQVTHRIDSPVSRDARSSDDQRRPHRVVVEVLFAEEPVTADRQSVIGREDDESVVVLVAFLQCVEDAADLCVEELDGGVIIGEVLADDFGSPRPGGELFIADDQRAIVERMLWEEVRGERRALGVVTVVIGLWGHAWVVWES